MEWKEGTWTPEEDKILENLVGKHGTVNWSLISKSMPGKSAKSCWSRWSFVHRPFTPDEDEMLKTLIGKHGSHWSLISKSMPGRLAKTCELRWDIIWHSLQSHEDIMNLTNTGALIPSPSLIDIGIGQGSSYIHNGNLSHEVGGVSGQAPSISDMAGENMSLEGTHEVGGVSGQAPSIGDMARDDVSQPSVGMHPYSGEQSPPSWDAFNQRDSSSMMIEGGDVQEFSRASILPYQELEDSTFTYIPVRSKYQSDADIYSAPFNQGQTLLAAYSSFTIAQEQKFTILEICPEWVYASEPSKVLIVGRFLCDPSKNKWNCMFGDTEVPVEIILGGVISCYAPPHTPGNVTIFITCGNHEACSEVREFEYRDKPHMHVPNTSTKNEIRSSEELLLLVKFVQMLLSDKIGQKGSEDSWTQIIEALLDDNLSSSRATDWLLEELLKDKLETWLSSKVQDDNTLPALSKGEQRIIHMVSGLGFVRALAPILKSGVGINFRDINGWTALHWASRFGREKMVAELLASGANPGAVTDPSQKDPIGKTAASIAATCGHNGLAGYLSEVELTSHLSSLTLKESELSKCSADVEAERTVNSISTQNLVVEDHLSLKDAIAAVRNAAQAASRIQAAFRAHSFKERKQKEAAEHERAGADEYGILPSDIAGLSAVSKLTYGKARHHNAALAIQKYRGWNGRKYFLTLGKKVVTIQAHVRGHQARKNCEAICWAVGIVEKIILRWRRKQVGLRGFHLNSIDESADEDISKIFQKQRVDVALPEAVSRVLSMVKSTPARQQYRRMLQKYQQAKAEQGGRENEGGTTSQLDAAAGMETEDLFDFV